ncbi:MAG TPA: hypothetical protein VMC02_00425 [Steroidobacteraceae bacterium]|nr:hypothetical protein [Steroidobacteraceae bacterium]
MNPSPDIARFDGPVEWVSGPGPAGITLLGRIAEPDGSTTPAQLSLICRDPPVLPARWPDLTVAVTTPPEVLLRSDRGEWRIACRTWQLHREVGAAFRAAVPPRPTPWSRRLAWRVLFGVAGTRAGRWLLALRR